MFSWGKFTGDLSVDAFSAPLRHPTRPRTGKKKNIHNHRGNSPFFLFPGLRPLWCIPFFLDLWWIPFSLVFPGNGIHHSYFFCSMTSGSGDRPRQEGCHGGGVCFFSLAQRTEIAAIFAICDCDAHRGPQKSLAISETLHCDLRMRWKVASDLRFRVAISEPETISFCGICCDLAPSTRKSLAIVIVRFWCAKFFWSKLRGWRKCQPFVEHFLSNTAFPLILLSSLQPCPCPT